MKFTRLPTRGLAKVGLEEYELNNISLINNKTWAETEVTQNTQPSPSLNVVGNFFRPLYGHFTYLLTEKIYKGT